MKKTRNTCNGLYYAISNPTSMNIHTGNFCINPKYYLAFDKDFLFEWIDPHTGKYETKILSKRYVINHAKPCYIWKESDLHIGKDFKGMCYLISYRDILAF